MPTLHTQSAHAGGTVPTQEVKHSRQKQHQKPPAWAFSGASYARLASFTPFVSSIFVRAYLPPLASLSADIGHTQRCGHGSVFTNLVIPTNIGQ